MKQKVQQEHPWNDFHSVSSWGWQSGIIPEPHRRDFSLLGEMGVGKNTVAYEPVVLRRGKTTQAVTSGGVGICRLAWLVRGLIHGHPILGLEDSWVLSVRTIKPVSEFCWFACLGFREPAHLRPGNLPAQHTGRLMLWWNRWKWISWSEMGES